MQPYRVVHDVLFGTLMQPRLSGFLIGRSLSAEEIRRCRATREYRSLSRRMKVRTLHELRKRRFAH